jgi:hypothetical protein
MAAMSARGSVGTLAMVTILLAIVMHLDWHAARPAVHHLSLGWRWHWLLAVPTFALTAWYVKRSWPDRLFDASLTIILTASLLAAIVEPAWEYWIDGASFNWAFGPLRIGAFAAFLLTGIVTQTGVLLLTRKADVMPKADSL